MRLILQPIEIRLRRLLGPAENNIRVQLYARDGELAAGVLFKVPDGIVFIAVDDKPVFDASARNVNMWQLDSAATNATSGSTRCGLPKYAGAAEPGTSMPLSNRQMCKSCS